jgi:putative holliday junction resolvase
VGRIVAIDVGEQRIGIAVSDATATLARPLKVLHAPGLGRAALAAVVAEVTRLAAEPDGVAAVVVGVPRRLDGAPGLMTARVEHWAARLRRRVPWDVVLQDERLSSHEAESRLAVRTRDWRARRTRLDAAAAAVILQDYLDARPPDRAGGVDAPGTEPSRT